MLPTRNRNTINSLSPFLASMSKPRRDSYHRPRDTPAPIVETPFLLYCTYGYIHLYFNNSLLFLEKKVANPLLIKNNLFYRYFYRRLLLMNRNNTLLLINVRLVGLGIVLFPSGEFGFACSDPSCVDFIFNFEY